MIDPYDVTSRVACHLAGVIANVPGYSPPVALHLIQHRMGVGVYACEGIGVAVTGITTGLARPNCPPDPQFALEVTMARVCAIEFSTTGQTIDPRADALARALSSDAAVLWEAFNTYQPVINWQITGGLGLATATFQMNGVWLPACGE